MHSPELWTVIVVFSVPTPPKFAVLTISCQGFETIETCSEIMNIGKVNYHLKVSFDFGSAYLKMNPVSSCRRLVHRPIVYLNKANLCEYG